MNKQQEIRFSAGMLLICLALVRPGFFYVPKVDGSSANALSTIVPFPAPGGFATTYLPEGRLHASAAGTLVLGGGASDAYMSYKQGESWTYLPDRVYWADDSVVALSPNFDQDQTLFRGLYYGSDAFLISTDSGQSWQLPGEMVVGPVQDITVSPGFAQDKTVYVVTTDYVSTTLLLTTDGGLHFEPLPGPASASPIAEIVLSPNYTQDHQIYLRLIDSSLWRSSNGGQTWQRADTGLSRGVDFYINDLELTFFDTDLALLIATSRGLMVSVDQGKSWMSFDESDSVLPFQQAAAAPLPFGRHTEIWAVSGQVPGNANHFLFHSLDSGETWEVFTFYTGPITDLLYSPGFQQDRTFYIKATDSLWKTTDLGDRFILLSEKPDFSFLSTYSDFNQLKLIKTADFQGVSHLFAFPKRVGYGSFPLTSSYWFLRSVNNGRDWAELPLPVSGAPVYIITSPDYAETKTIFAGIGSEFYRSQNAGESWQLLSTAPFQFEALAISPAFAEDRTLIAGSYFGGAYLSTDGGASWVKISESDTYVTGLHFSPAYASDKTIFLSAAGDAYKSEDSGDTWSSLGARDMILAVSPDYANDQTLYSGEWNSSAGRLSRSTDGGETWTVLEGLTASSYYHTIELSPNFAEDGTLIVGMDCQPLFISEDRGETWYALSDLPTPCGYRASAGVVLTHQGSLLQPVVSDRYRVFTYAWPAVSGLPEWIYISTPHGSHSPVVKTLFLSVPDGDGFAWRVIEKPDWLEAAPESGALPGEIALTIDPAAAPQSLAGQILFEFEWTEKQVEKTVHRVSFVYYKDQLYLPVLMRR